MALGNDTHMSVSDAAKEIGVSDDTIRRWIEEGRFTDIRKPGPRSTLVSREEVKKISNQNFFAAQAAQDA